MPLSRRLAGLLLHPTSLPGPLGIGDLGPGAYRFLDWLQAAGLAYWQVLPLGPTSFGDSPYQCFSAFAGNPLLVSLTTLRDQGLLSVEEMLPPEFPVDRVDYGAVIHWKQERLAHAHHVYVSGSFPEIRQRFEAFAARPDVKVWLDDYALFMACKDANEGRAWNTWEPALRSFKPTAVNKARKQYAERIEYHRFAQFLFFDQWDALHQECRNRGIEIIGDAPIYVSYDSADTWANQEFFQLDKEGNPTHVAGVPPDYFSATGQLWGNPLYRWDKMESDGFTWWINRMRSVLAQVDYVRLDHFRGFMGYYAVPFGSATAETGEWVKGPGARLFSRLREVLGDLPIIAEDLGEITTDVTETRLQFGLPGMKIMQFAWSPATMEPPIPDPNNQFQLHRHDQNMVVYTGTHDNDTSVGWWHNSSTPAERTMMQIYLATDGNSPNWDLIRAAFMSVACTAVIPAQDFLGLGTEARMNYPGRGENNWSWRLREGQLDDALARRVREMTLVYERCANPPEGLTVATPKTPNY